MAMLINGVKPPKSCYVCGWYNKVECPVNDGRYYYRAQRHPSCPLIELPPHGRLADLDKIIEDYWDGTNMEIDEGDLKAIIQYKVVIEAEGETE